MKRNIQHIRTVADYNAQVGAPAEHPLVGVVCYDELAGMQDAVNRFDIYGLFLRDDTGSSLSYGTGSYAYEAGTLICVAPGQIGGDEERGQGGGIRGWALFFSPELIHGTRLEARMKEFRFFSYGSSEALRMTPGERETFLSLLQQIRREIRLPSDGSTDAILLSLLELVLEHCRRFYTRQFQTEGAGASGLLTRFEQLLEQYYEDGRQAEEGIPSVRFCASELCLSPNYFGDLIRSLTGKSAKDTIRDYVLERAKGLLRGGMSVVDTAYALGFNYPNHFTRAFKQRFGVLPSEYQKPRQV